MKSVFVSHSSQDRTLTEAVCGHLRTPGSDIGPIADYDVLVDYDRLVAGREWPRQLHEWLARCHAGLLLLTPAAVASPWVLKEATVLAWRLCLEDEFRLFVVRYPGVTKETLEAGRFGPLALERVQRVVATEPDAIAAAVREELGSARAPPTLFDRLVTTLGALLSDVKADPLRRIAEAVRVEPPAWRPDRERKDQYVEEIARRLLCESLGQYRGVNELVDVLAQTTPAETVRDILRVVAPYWVDGSAAGTLPGLAAREPRGTAALNGERVVRYTALMYVSRAHPLSLSWEYVPIPSASAGDFVGDVKREICEVIRRRENEDMSDDEIVADLADRPSPVYAALPFLPPKQDLEDLRTLFPGITFLLSTGPTLERAPELDDVTWLEPPLDVAAERAHARSFAEAERIIRRKQSQLQRG